MLFCLLLFRRFPVYPLFRRDGSSVDREADRRYVFGKSSCLDIAGACRRAMAQWKGKCVISHAPNAVLSLGEPSVSGGRWESPLRQGGRRVGHRWTHRCRGCLIRGFERRCAANNGRLLPFEGALFARIREPRHTRPGILFGSIFPRFINVWISSRSGEIVGRRSLARRGWPVNCSPKGCNVTVVAGKQGSVL